MSGVYRLFYALSFPAGIATQVVVPSVSLAAVPQGTDLTVFVENHHPQSLSKPMVVPGSNGRSSPAVAELTRSPVIQLNERVSLRGLAKAIP